MKDIFSFLRKSYLLRRPFESEIDMFLCSAKELLVISSAKEDPLELETRMVDEFGLPLNSLPDLQGVDKKLKEDKSTRYTKYYSCFTFNQRCDQKYSWEVGGK